MPTLRLTQEQAAKLARWLRTAGAAMRSRGKELEDAAAGHSMGEAIRKNAEVEYASADHAERLADRLDPAFRESLERTGLG